MKKLLIFCAEVPSYDTSYVFLGHLCIQTYFLLLQIVENEITRQDNCLVRHPSENLRAYLLTTLAAPLNGSGQRLIHQFCDLYEHARHDPSHFGDEEYQTYNRLLLKLVDA